MEKGEGETGGWTEIDVSVLQPPDETEIPFRLVVNRFKSSTDDCEAFIHDPLAVLIEAGSANEALSVVGPDWTVVTLVTNHHRTLSAIHLYAMAAVNPTEKIVSLTLVKKAPTDS